MSGMVYQPDRQQQDTTAKGRNQAVTSLNREFRTVLINEEAAEIGRAVAQIVRGDGWYEAKASAVLVSAIVAWLGQDAVQPLGFYANGTGPVEIVARVGSYIISSRGIETEDDVTRNACERHRARYSQSRLDDMDLAEANSRFTMGAMLTEEIDPEIARVVLGAL
jgi:hypothetical protein